MRAYYFDNLPGDQRLPHEPQPPKPVPAETLSRLGLKFWNIPSENHEPQIDAIARERGYKNRDVINVSKEGMGEAYEGKIKMFFEEWVPLSSRHAHNTLSARQTSTRGRGDSLRYRRERVL